MGGRALDSQELDQELSVPDQYHVFVRLQHASQALQSLNCQYVRRSNSWKRSSTVSRMDIAIELLVANLSLFLSTTHFLIEFTVSQFPCSDFPTASELTRKRSARSAKASAEHNSYVISHLYKPLGDTCQLPSGAMECLRFRSSLDVSSRPAKGG